MILPIIKRALEIEKSTIEDTINNCSYTSTRALISFISTHAINDDELNALNEIVKNALQASFEDRHKPLNVLVRRAIEWQAERLARLENEHD